MPARRHERRLKQGDDKCLAASREMITLESQFLDGLRLRLINSSRESTHTMTNLMKRSDAQMKKEIHRVCEPGVSRYRRQVYLSRQSELVGCFKAFNENLLMMRCEFEARIERFYADRDWLNGTTQVFMQSLEASLTTQKEKLKQRMLGYARDFIDQLTEDELVVEKQGLGALPPPPKLSTDDGMSLHSGEGSASSAGSLASVFKSRSYEAYFLALSKVCSCG